MADQTNLQETLRVLTERADEQQLTTTTMLTLLLHKGVITSDEYAAHLDLVRRTADELEANPGSRGPVERFLAILRGAAVTEP